MYKIYHNPRCSKSRQGLALLEAMGVNYEIIKYLDTSLSKEELKNIVKKLGIKPIKLVRTKEAIWKENFKDLQLSDEAVIEAMVTHPKLIERPIVEKGDKAVLGRPPEEIKKLL